MRLNRKFKAIFLSLALIVGSMFNVGCGKDRVEKSIATFVRAVKSARQITTEQNRYGHITDAEYASRLRLFLKVYEASDKLGDELVKFGEINETNKADILPLVRSVNNAVAELIQTGNLGVKNDKSKAEFTRWLFVASATISAIEIAVAAIKKPVPTADIKVERVN